MAQVEPYQTHTVQSEIAGIVKKIALDKEFSYVTKGTKIVELDTEVEDISISQISKKIVSIKEALQLKRENLKNKSKIRQISKYDINRETLAVLDTKISLYSAEMELKLKKSNREKKIFYLSNGYLGKIYVDEFEFVGFGGKLFEYYDFSKSRIDIYVNIDEVENIREKKIFLDGVEAQDWYIEKVSKIKDAKRISTVLVRLVKNNPNPKTAEFKKIYKVEFR
jgi:hypothetical protein